jgi:phosphopantetheinyl transferase/N-acetylglutamate synthase-like GNAT family acetyltransferase
VAELSEEERARAARFATDAIRNRWLHGHVAMRRILAREAGVPPSAIGYGTGEHGKPFVASPAGTGIEFSYSDAEDLALLAVSRRGPLGVDVERLDPGVESDAIAESRFAARERDALRQTPSGERPARFVRLWARKEAALKAIGIGLPFGLAKVEVPVDSALACAVEISIEGSSSRWWVEDIDVPSPFAAAIVRPAGTTLRVSSHAVVRLVPFTASHREAYYALNRAWLDDNDLYEHADEAELRDPEGTILARAGEIIVAIDEGRVVGTVALRHLEPGAFELVKLSVARDARGRGIGRSLVEWVLTRAVERGASRVLLTTSSTLEPAVGLYSALGFRRIPLPPWNLYDTADVAMEWTRPD